MLNVVYGTVYTLCLYCTYLKKCLSNLTFYMASVDREERVPKTRRFKALLAGRIWAYILCCWGKKIQDDGFGLRRNTTYHQQPHGETFKTFLLLLLPRTMSICDKV